MDYAIRNALLLGDKLTLSLVCPLTAEAFPAACSVYKKWMRYRSRTAQRIVVRWKRGSTTAQSVGVVNNYNTQVGILFSSTINILRKHFALR